MVIFMSELFTIVETRITMSVADETSEKEMGAKHNQTDEIELNPTAVDDHEPVIEVKAEPSSDTKLAEELKPVELIKRLETIREIKSEQFLEGFSTVSRHFGVYKEEHSNQ